MEWKIPLFKMYSDEEDVKAVTEIIRRGTYWADGPEIKEFEKRITDYVGTKYALTFNSGTSALHTLFLAYDIKGKEVIVPSFTFIATANAVILAGGKPVFAEAEDETYGLDAEDVKKRITKKTKAIMAIHYGGFPARDSEKLRKLANQHGILFIEDAAESLGAHINGKKVGTFGHSAMFSFCQNKILTTGEGGIIVTDDEKIYEKAKLLRSHGRVEEAQDYFSSTGDNDYIEVGYNFRMPTMLAGLGMSQLKKIQRVIDSRREKAHYISKSLAQIKQIAVPKELPGHYQVYQMYTIKIENEKTRDKLQEHLTKKGIMSKVYFNPVHLKTIYKRDYGYKDGDLPKTEKVSKVVLSIPLYPTMKKEELDYIIKTIRDFFERFGGK
jgi:dTDP-4-amino-4,6-dideoxygalactose transaminase